MIPLAKPLLGDAERAAVARVLDSGQLVQGEEVAAFEREFAEAVGARHAVATSSGTTALHLALSAHGIGEGASVLTTPFTFLATAHAILHAGGRPVFVDVEPDTFNLDPARLPGALTSRARAIVPVHLFGQPCDMDAIDAFAEAHGLVVIEDAAQAVGASYKGRKVGSTHTACFSLHATKNITSGEGGMVTTNDDAIADAVRLERSHGMRVRYVHERVGWNFRMSELHAAIGRVQLRRLGEFTAKRRANAAYFTERLHRVEVPVVREDAEHVFHQYTLLSDRRDALAERLLERGVATGVYYRTPAHRQAAMLELGFGGGDFPTADRLAGRVLSIPVHPGLTEADRAAIVQAIDEAER